MEKDTNSSVTEESSVNADKSPRSPSEGEKEIEKGGRPELYSGSLGQKRDRSPSPSKKPSSEEKSTKKSKFDLLKIVSTKERRKWELPGELAEYFNSYTKAFIPDKDLSEEMENYPPPSNISCSPTLDSYMERLLKDEGQNAIIDVDGDLAKIQGKIEAVMGPLGVAWSSMELWKVGEAEELDPESMTDQLQKAVILLGQAAQKVSYVRRLNILSKIGSVKEAKGLLKEEKTQNIFKECNTGELFSKDFKDPVKTENDSRKCVAEFFSKKKDKTPLKRKNPFPASPFPKGRGSFQHSSAGASNQQPRSFSGRGFSTFRKKEYPSRGIYNQQSFGQHALSSRMVALSGPCSPSDRKLVQINRGGITSSREDSKIPPELAINNKRSGYTKHRQRLGNPFRRNSYSKENTLSNKNEQGGGDGNRFGNRGHTEKRSNQSGNPKEGPVSEQYLCDTKRG